MRSRYTHIVSRPLLSLFPSSLVPFQHLNVFACLKHVSIYLQQHPNLDHGICLLILWTEDVPEHLIGSCPSNNTGVIAIVGVVPFALGSLVTTIVWHYLNTGITCAGFGASQVKFWIEDITQLLHGPSIWSTTLKKLAKPYFVQEDMKHYGERYFWDKERSHDTIVNRNNDLVDHAEKASKALLSEQEDVKHYVLPG